MPVIGVHHCSFTVTNIERTVNFYTTVVGVELQSRTRNRYDTLGRALFGTKWGMDQAEADLEIAVMRIGGNKIEFIQYMDPISLPYHQNPSIAGSAHLALRVDDIQAERERLEALGVEFHSPINVFQETGKPEWKWCYFRDPDGICLELVEQSEA